MTTYIVIAAKPASVEISGLLTLELRRARQASQLARHRDLLAQSLSDPARAALLRSVSGSPPATPWRGSGTRRMRPPQSLDALGAIIIDSLSTDEIDRLREQGAHVIENREIEGFDPIVGPSSITSGVAPTVPWHLSKIGAPAYHARGITGAGVTIGIADSGIDPNHPEFLGKTVYYQAFDGAGTQLTHGAKDYGHHGTHVSGIAAGGRCGVAPAASLAIAAVLTDDGGRKGTLAQVLAGLNWLSQTDFPTGPVSVINASLGSKGYNDYAYQPLRDARNLQGVTVVAAIGNAGPQLDQHGSPGNYDCAIGVGATDDADAVAPFSDYGTVVQHGGIHKPDLCAPGVLILSALPQATYGELGGTSMASPVVAGACALLIQERPELSFAPDGLLRAILGATIPLPQQRGSGRGRLQL